MLEQQQTISFSDYSSLYDLIIPKDNPLRQIIGRVSKSYPAVPSLFLLHLHPLLIILRVGDDMI